MQVAFPLMLIYQFNMISTVFSGLFLELDKFIIRFI